MTKIEKAERLLRSTPGVIGFGALRHNGTDRHAIVRAARRTGISIHAITNLGYRVAP